jgi:predicted GNAT family N-acyltransferase
VSGGQGGAAVDVNGGHGGAAVDATDGQGGELLRIGDWSALGADAGAVRRAVFVDEQGIPAELEWDEWDERSLHAVLYVGDVPVATGRLLPDAHIGRMAVLPAHRRQRLGARILERLVAEAAARGNVAVELNAQSHVCAFYAAHGFEAFGDEYDEVGIPHRRMRRRLAQR